jgi:thiol-disulfide isomerase/thioredoxin
MKRTFAALCLISLGFAGFSQSGYDIKVNFKGSKDTMVYLVKYTFDQKYIADTCKNIKNGQMHFKGKTDLDRGVYTLVSQDKAIYFDLFVNEGQRFSISTDAADIVNNLKAVGSKENEQFFSYIRFITNKNKDFSKVREKTTGMSKADSTKFIQEKIKELNTEVKKFETDFLLKVKGSYLYDVLNMKTEKEPAEIPKAKNGRPDSIFQYYYYKSHFWDGVNFKDERVVRTPFFADRVKRYFDQVLLMHPDTIIQEIDKMLGKCEEDNLVYNVLIGYFTYKFEQSKVMGFDKVFVHLADKYIISGHAKKVYSEETITKIKERVDILRNLLLDSKVKELYVIDTVYGRQVRKMGFDTANSSRAITDLYYKNIEKLTPMFRSLYQLNARYTILVFWAVDCGHCQTEIPKLHEELEKVKGKIDYKVFAVQTKDDLFDTWRKFIIEKKLNDFIHVFDPIHLNNVKETYDIYSTPVIYILDKDKKIKAKRVGAEQVVDILKTLDSLDKEAARQKGK